MFQTLKTLLSSYWYRNETILQHKDPNLAVNFMFMFSCQDFKGGILNVDFVISKPSN